jgi:hypothetical protein
VPSASLAVLLAPAPMRSAAMSEASRIDSNGDVESCASNAAALVDVGALLKQFLDGGSVTSGDRGEELLSRLDIDLLAPLANVDRVEVTSHGLSARILFNELYKLEEII